MVKVSWVLYLNFTYVLKYVNDKELSNSLYILQNNIFVQRFEYNNK